MGKSIHRIINPTSCSKNPPIHPHPSVRMTKCGWRRKRNNGRHSAAFNSSTIQKKKKLEKIHFHSSHIQKLIHESGAFHPQRFHR